jgi:pyruvate formate lyase activating enzyme
MKDGHITNEKSLANAYNIGKKAGLNYIYIGNLISEKFENTYCPSCKKLLIERRGYNIIENNIIESKCKFCGFKIFGVF